MARDYQKKLERMRAYAKTPAGREAQQRARDAFVIRRSTAIKSLKVNSKPLIEAIAHWR